MSGSRTTRSALLVIVMVAAAAALVLLLQRRLGGSRETFVTTVDDIEHCFYENDHPMWYTLKSPVTPTKLSVGGLTVQSNGNDLETTVADQTPFVISIAAGGGQQPQTTTLQTNGVSAQTTPLRATQSVVLAQYDPATKAQPGPQLSKDGVVAQAIVLEGDAGHEITIAPDRIAIDGEEMTSTEFGTATAHAWNLLGGGDKSGTAREVNTSGERLSSVFQSLTVENGYTAAGGTTTVDDRAQLNAGLSCEVARLGGARAGDDWSLIGNNNVFLALNRNKLPLASLPTADPAHPSSKLAADELCIGGTCANSAQMNILRGTQEFLVTRRKTPDGASRAVGDRLVHLDGGRATFRRRVTPEVVDGQTMRLGTTSAVPIRYDLVDFTLQSNSGFLGWVGQGSSCKHKCNPKGLLRGQSGAMSQMVGAFPADVITKEMESLTHWTIMRIDAYDQWQCYLDNNGDVARAYGKTNIAGAMAHYTVFGHREGAHIERGRWRRGRSKICGQGTAAQDIPYMRYGDTVYMMPSGQPKRPPWKLSSGCAWAERGKFDVSLRRNSDTTARWSVKGEGKQDGTFVLGGDRVRFELRWGVDRQKTTFGGVLVRGPAGLSVGAETTCDIMGHKKTFKSLVVPISSAGSTESWIIEAIARS